MFTKIYQYIRAFSLDVVAGAVISARWIGNYFNADIPSQAILALGLTVWLIYTIDHLLDARKIKSKDALFRHMIHYKNAPYIFGLIALVAMILIFVLQSLEPYLIGYGMVLGFAVFCYLIFVHFVRKKVYWGKEWFIALVYAMGICLPTVGYIQNVPPILIYFWLQLFLLASINLILFNMIEYKVDKAQGFNSFATVKGVDFSRKVILFLLFCFVITWSSSFLFFKAEELLDYQAIFILMGSVLAMVLSKEVVLRQEEWYRVIGDIVFVLPVIEVIFIDG
ncbi:UbiA prenyltransferase family protein [Marivirga sericea]|uniref:UbiA prenyltransferase family protein n=1 Tax=Marivirga sericea TaxID=1028 RepID=A0A1X7JBR9_9BACT|nr:UbiA prenyltransferase family protein [Marivirga sericea]SMG25095.1 UbiA prenyltransferase family protein [Marivirga sericea]